MKILSILTVFSLLLYSCSTYQYYTMSGNIQSNEDESFYYDSDLLDINYKFISDGILVIDILNQSDSMIYIDWDRSSLIYNDESISFAQDESYFQGSSAYYHPLGSDFSGVIYSNPNRKYIPPKTHYKESIALNFVEFLDLTKTGFTERTGTQNTPKTYHYSREKSPLAFETYLHFSKDKIESEPTIVRHSFWTEKIISTSSSDIPKKNNVFMLEEVDAGGAAFALVVGGTGLILLTVMNSEENADIQ